jgi:hypothetical protein
VKNIDRLTPVPIGRGPGCAEGHDEAKSRFDAGVASPRTGCRRFIQEGMHAADSDGSHDGDRRLGAGCQDAADEGALEYRQSLMESVGGDRRQAGDLEEPDEFAKRVGRGNRGRPYWIMIMSRFFSVVGLWSNSVIDAAVREGNWGAN